MNLFSKGENVINNLGECGVRLSLFLGGVGDVKSLDKILSQTCLSALCIETVSKIHSCSAKVALKML